MAKAMHRQVSSKKPQKRTRSDYRTIPEGTVAHYLIHLYPLGMDYSPSLDYTPMQLHDSAVDHKGNYVRLDLDGIPEVKAKVLDKITAIPFAVWRDAIAELRAFEDGRGLVQALECYQNLRISKLAGRSAEDIAQEIGVSARTLCNMRDRAISLVTVLAMRRCK